MLGSPGMRVGPYTSSLTPVGIALRIISKRHFSSPTPAVVLPKSIDGRMMDCVLVRHGESEGNVAYNKSWVGDHSFYSGAFMDRHSSLWRLTDRGRGQAAIAGEWLRKNVPQKFDRFYVSEYIRAMETAGCLGLSNSTWQTEVQLRERDWGQFDILSQQERVVKYHQEGKRKERDSLFYAPPGGESLVQVLTRVDGLLRHTNVQCADKAVILVCHGEVMWTFRLRFERLTHLQYRDMEAAQEQEERIHNCQILWYSRRNPITGEVSDTFRWKRSVCPWDLSLSSNDWKEMQVPSHTNESLIAHAERVPRIYNNTAAVSDRTADKAIPEAATSASAVSVGSFSPPVPGKLPREPRVLMLAKVARYEHEEKTRGKSGVALHQELRQLGFVTDRLVQGYLRHVDGVAQLTRALQAEGIVAKVKHVDECQPDDLNGVDLVVAAGGDGTILKAAALLKKPIPLLGVNTDPVHSVGFLSCFALHEATTAFHVLEHIRGGNFVFHKRSRIQATLVDGKTGQETFLPTLALNDILIAERDPARPTVCEITIDNSPSEVQRSSGFLMSTGTGSTAWMSNAAGLSPAQVESVAVELQTLYHDIPEYDASVIANRINSRLMMPPDSSLIQFWVREPIVTGLATPYRHRFGRAMRVAVRSLGWDTVINIDGISTYPLPKGVTAVLRIDPVGDLTTLSIAGAPEPAFSRQ